jgi:hypothetical protein
MKIIFVEDFVVDISLVLSTTWKKVFQIAFWCFNNKFFITSKIHTCCNFLFFAFHYWLIDHLCAMDVCDKKMQRL